ncbi:MAG TPA: hypothetical protein VNT22_07335 [Baekduia sp.]|nr:hypothetical protein [Baekduia sp.]
MPFPHISGSLPLDDAEAVFAWAGRALGDRTRLIPDGETTPQRRSWMPHLPWFDANPTIEHGEPMEFGGEFFPTYRVKDGAEVAFNEPFEFQTWARESYATFKSARDAGVLPSHAKLLVAFPHSTDAVIHAVEAASFEAIYEAYVAQLQVSVQEIADSIPHEDLAMQWDIPTAAVLWTGGGAFLGLSDSDRPSILNEVVRHGEWVPEGVELGYHLCFGDGNNAENVAGDSDIDIEEDTAEDTAGLAELCNDIVRETDRRVDFLHLPTYAHWIERQQFEPLQGLDIDGAELSLGVINLRRDRGLENGVQRARQRTAAAVEAIGPTFGISSTCGLGRYTPAQFAAASDLFAELDQG